MSDEPEVREAPPYYFNISDVHPDREGGEGFRVDITAEVHGVVFWKPCVVIGHRKLDQLHEAMTAQVKRGLQELVLELLHYTGTHCTPAP